MKFLGATFSAVLFAAVVTNSWAAESVTKAAGGSIKTKLGDGFILNKESSLPGPHPLTYSPPRLFSRMARTPAPR